MNDANAHAALEAIGHDVGAFDSRSMLMPHLAVETVRQIVHEVWDDEWPDWQPAHDAPEHGDCSPWCPACRKNRLPPCS